MNTYAEELALSVIQLEASIHHGSDFEEELENADDQLREELAIIAAEDGMDRELDYDSQRHYEGVIEAAHVATKHKYEF